MIEGETFEEGRPIKGGIERRKGGKDVGTWERVEREREKNDDSSSSSCPPSSKPVWLSRDKLVYLDFYADPRHLAVSWRESSPVR